MSMCKLLDQLFNEHGTALITSKAVSFRCRPKTVSRTGVSKSSRV